jgi:hypothetical protein
MVAHLGLHKEYSMEMVGHDAKGYQAYLGMETGDSMPLGLYGLA